MHDQQSAAPSRAEINRANAQLSTGPRTEAGKQRSKFNARRHNLTGQVLISDETDLKAYFESSARLVADLRPEGEFETRLAQSLADAQWQLDRARAIETNLFFELASKRIPEEPAANPSEADGNWATAQAQAFLENAKQFDLMSRYATRYQRQVLQLHKALVEVQKERRQWDQKRNQQRLERQRQDLAQRGATHQKQAGNQPNGFVSQSPFTGLNPDRQGGDFAPQALPHSKKTLHQIAQEAIQNRKNQAA